MKLNQNKGQITVATVLDLYPHLGIPHFQRGLVWGNDTVASLLESLYWDTPCGSFVFWNSGTNLEHGVSMPGGSKDGISYLVVDGQQRIRSLHQIFNNEGESDIDDTGSTDDEDDERDDAKAWCINLTQLDDFKEILEERNREYSLFVYTTRPETADNRSPLRHNVLPIDTLLDESSTYNHAQYLRLSSDQHESKLVGLLANLKSRMKDILRREFFYTVKYDRPGDVINLYNRINSGGKRVEAEEKAFARLVSLYPQSYHHVKAIFDKVHEIPADEEIAARTKLDRDDVMRRQKENRFGFKLFIRTFIQVSNYHFNRSLGSQSLSFKVVHSDCFTGLMEGNDSKKIEDLWIETRDVIATVRSLLKHDLFFDDLAFLPDTLSLIPIFQMIIQYPALREPQYRHVLGWATLSLLLANQDGKDILSLVSTLRDEELASEVLPGMLKDLDMDARRTIKTPQTLEDASTIQNRYVLLLYGLLRRQGVRDFSYKNINKSSPLTGKEECLIAEACCPEKQHIAPFSCLVKAMNDRDAKRGSDHPFNNIGNLTYISSSLNHYETGLGADPIDRTIEPDKNLQAHYLHDDDHGKVGQLYDKLIDILREGNGTPVETIDSLFESFCKARRRHISQGFISWLDDLSLSAQKVMAEADQRDVKFRFEASIPRCTRLQDLPSTLQVRSMNYPNESEDALVGYLRVIGDCKTFKKRWKVRDDEIELLLSGKGAIRLLMRPVGIEVTYNEVIPQDERTSLDSMLGITRDDRYLHRQDRNGSVSLDLLNRASAESERLDGLEQQHRDLAKKRKKGPCDPFFAAVIEAYDQDAVEEWKAIGGGRTYRQVYPDDWEDGVHYEFMHNVATVSVELHIESDEMRSLGLLLAPFDGKELLPGVLLRWDPKFYCKRGRLLAEISKDQNPKVAAKAMKALISLTYNVIENYLNA